MPERSSIFQVVQIGVESTAGTPVAANKLLQSVSMEIGPKVDVSIFRAQGQKFPALAGLNKEWIEGKLSGMLTYTEILYLLAGAIKKVAPTGATLAKTWTYAPANAAADTAQTYTVEQGSSVRAHSFPFGILTSLGMSFSRSGCEVNADLIGKAMTDGITMTAAPGVVALKPVMPTQVSVYMADTYAGLAGASALTRVIKADWQISDRFAPLWVLSGTTSWVGQVETEPKLSLSLTVEADAEGMGLLSTVRTGATKFIRIKAVSDIIETTVPYTLQIDTAVKIGDIDNFSDEDGVYAIGYSMQGAYDATWGKATEIVVINELTTANTGLS